MTKANAKQQAAQNMDALFGARQGERLVSNGFKMLAHERITVRPQVRRTFDPSEMDELRASIRALRAQEGGIEGTGVLQALLVAPREDGYRLIAGEKRFRATREEGIPQVPCVIVPAVSEGMTRLLQLTENALRSAPPVLEEARALQETREEQGLSVRDLARLLGKTGGYVTNRLSLLKMAPDVQAMVEARPDTLKHAPLIEKVADLPQRTELIRAVIEDELSVKALERRLQPAASHSRTAEDEPGQVRGKEAQEEGVQDSVGETQSQAVLTNNQPDGRESPTANPTEPLSERPRSLPQGKPLSHPHVGHPRDPLGDLLRPAASMAGEAVRLLAVAHITPDEKKQIHAQIRALEGSMTALKQLLR